ncbi:diamine acetyltransferase 1-like isoform X2 [Littorina saxatilis]|uniref:N-acetyltransferase domain-containing protein n=1 Tax=Littorina saxatilis TaxID=31220 RepID=A0AAN9AP39_9CAEN
MADVTVREATVHDCEEIMRLIKELAVHHNEADKVAIDEHVLRRDGFGDTPYFHCLVAEPSTQGTGQQRPLVGYAMYYWTYSPWCGKTCCLEDLFVTKDWRNHGVGTLLWAHVTKTALARECAWVHWVVMDWNQQARDFYHGNGATNWSEKDGRLVYRMTHGTMTTFVNKRLPETA